MKTDEVLTDEQLRIKAAELLGWTGVGRCPEGCPHACEMRAGAGIYGFRPRVSQFTRNWTSIPDYPNDIAAAWELVEASGLQFQVGNTRHCSDSWWAKFRGGKPQVHADSAPKAITIAFILAMEGRVPEGRVRDE